MMRITLIILLLAFIAYGAIGVVCLLACCLLSGRISAEKENVE